MRFRFRGNGLALLLATMSIACATKRDTTQVSSNQNLNSKRMGLIAAPRTLDSDGGADEQRKRKDLAQDIAKATGQVVSLLNPHRINDTATALMRAAAERSDILIFIQHPHGVPNGFVGATAHNVTTGELLGETAVAREPSREVISEIRQWAASLKSVFEKQPTLRPSELAERYWSDRSCEEVVTGLEPWVGEELQPELEKLYLDCAKTMEKDKRSKVRSVVQLRMFNVAAEDRAAFENAVESAGVARALDPLVDQDSDLLVLCKDKCDSGQIRLALEMDAGSYRTAVPAGQYSLVPFEPVAAALLRFRSLAARNVNSARQRTVAGLTIEIALAKGDPGEFRIPVSGSAEKPRLNTTSSVTTYLQEISESEP